MSETWKRHIFFTAEQLAKEFGVGGDFFRAFVEPEGTYIHMISESKTSFPGAYLLDSHAHVEAHTFYYEVECDDKGKEISRVRRWTGLPFPDVKQVT